LKNRRTSREWWKSWNIYFLMTRFKKLHQKKNYRPWDLMDWVKKWKLLAIEAIQYNKQPCIKIEDLWKALHQTQTFNSAQSQWVDISLLEKLPFKPYSIWNLFSREKFMMAISKCNNSSASGLDRILWRHLKLIFKDNKCLENIINIGHWLLHFKVSSSIIIPKLNKVTYNSPKSFCPIILLNTLGKLMKKVIGRWLQFHPSKSTWRTQTMFHNRCRSCLNAFNLIWMGQEPLDKYISL